MTPSDATPAASRPQLAKSQLDRAPVIVGVGEILERTEDPADGRHPLRLMADALVEAEADAGGDWIARLDHVDVINSVSWPYRDPGAELAALLGLPAEKAHYGQVGGETPIRRLNAAARAIAEGKARAWAIVGAEAADTVARATREGLTLPWPDPAAPAPRLDFKALFHPAVSENALTRPLIVYPFYEYAAAAHWKQSPADARAESARIWEGLSKVASTNPDAWIRRPHSAEEIAAPTPANRRVGGPYTKLMVANPLVNQGAAVIVTSRAEALAAGVPEDRLIHVFPGCGAEEPRDFTARDVYHRSWAQEAVLEGTLRAARAQGVTPGLHELYSCFPCVPKMARRTLGLSPEAPTTVTGGLTFHGAPLNDYMTHAICAMVHVLRRGGGESTGLLYGQGEFVTKHQGAILSREAPVAPFAPEADAQGAADARRGAVPPVNQAYAGKARLETFTLDYDRAGKPIWAVVFARGEDGSRTLARLDAGEEDDLLAALVEKESLLIGAEGRVAPGPDGRPRWRM